MIKTQQKTYDSCIYKSKCNKHGTKKVFIDEKAIHYARISDSKTDRNGTNHTRLRQLKYKKQQKKIRLMCLKVKKQQTSNN